MSCSVLGCGFGKVQNPTKSRRRRSGNKLRKYRRRSRRSGNKSRKHRRRSRRFGFKFLRNDQIINRVFHNYPANLTCDRA